MEAVLRELDGRKLILPKRDEMALLYIMSPSASTEFTPIIRTQLMCDRNHFKTSQLMNDTSPYKNTRNFLHIFNKTK